MNIPKDNRTQTSPQNGHHSQGPKSPTTKQISAQNATTHGAYSTKLLIPGEDPAELQLLLDSHLQLFHPANPIELHLVREMAHTLWRARRFSTAETTLINIQIRRMDAAFYAEFESVSPDTAFSLAQHSLHAHSTATAQLARQERRLLRQYTLLRQELLSLRQLPPAPIPQPATSPEAHPETNAKKYCDETNLISTGELPLKITNPSAEIFQYLPQPRPKPPIAESTRPTPARQTAPA